MSIVTKTGDAGMTALMYHRRVSKCDPRVEACGTVDELNAALGMARATVPDLAMRDRLHAIQSDLIQLMGELATATEDLPRFERGGFHRVNSAMTARLEEWVKSMEARKITFAGWALPGDNLPSATLDMARTVCRRAERRVCGLLEADQLLNPEAIVYLNRLSDLLWLFARQMDGPPPAPPTAEPRENR